jgi:threonine dehydratase
MAAAAKWLGVQGEKRTVLIILSGGNISPETYLKIWQHNLLEQLPSLIQSNKKVMTA